jgi:hypothetical protein
MKSRSHSLMSTGQTLRNEEFILYLLSGLDSELSCVWSHQHPHHVDPNSRSISPAPGDGATRERTKGQDSIIPNSAHVAAYGAFGIPYPNLCPTYQPDSRPPPTRYVQPMTRHTGPFASMSYNDNGGWKNNNENTRSVVYELCGIPRHTTSKCYKRSHRDFLEVGNNGRNAKKQIAMVPNVAIDSTFYGGQTTSRLVDPMW